MIYKIRAVDQLFFRSGTPFEAKGETHLLKSQFPPYPGTYSGSFAYFMEGDKKGRKLKISYNGILCDETFCFPKPLDTAVIDSSTTQSGNAREEKHYKLERMKLTKKPPSNFPLSYCLARQTDVAKKDKSSDDIYVNQQSLQQYLNGEASELNAFSLSNYFENERKIGIRTKSKTGKTEEGMLYQIGMVQPGQRLQLAVELKDLEIVEHQSISLGAEGRVAEVTAFAEGLVMPAIESDSEYFKLYFATPAIFGNGWYPQWIDQETKVGSFLFKKRKVTLELIAASMGRYEAIGGFDTKKGKPKEMKYAVPAGSVYYFKILDGDFKTAMKLFNQKCISDCRENMSGLKFENHEIDKQQKNGFSKMNFSRDRLVYCDRGFGYAMVGKLNEKEEAQLECLKRKN